MSCWLYRGFVCAVLYIGVVVPSPDFFDRDEPSFSPLFFQDVRVGGLGLAHRGWGVGWLQACPTASQLAMVGFRRLVSHGCSSAPCGGLGRSWWLSSAGSWHGAHASQPIRCCEGSSVNFFYGLFPTRARIPGTLHQCTACHCRWWLCPGDRRWHSSASWLLSPHGWLVSFWILQPVGTCCSGRQWAGMTCRWLRTSLMTQIARVWLGWGTVGVVPSVVHLGVLGTQGRTCTRVLCPCWNRSSTLCPVPGVAFYWCPGAPSGVFSGSLPSCCPGWRFDVPCIWLRIPCTARHGMTNMVAGQWEVPW